MSNTLLKLTKRQKREIDYHRNYAKEQRKILDLPFSRNVLKKNSQRWWNAYWEMYGYLIGCELTGKSVLVVGCGFGYDAIRISMLGAIVSAFDISPDCIQIACELAAREGLQIAFEEMAAEEMQYKDSSFDYIIARDILHHVDIPLTMREIVRVAKPDAIFVMNEVYSHSVTDKIRYASLVKNVLYPRMRRFIYGSGNPYITEDERKLNETDLYEIGKHLLQIQVEKHFNLFVNRIVPDKFEYFAKIDRLLLRLMKPIGRLLAGRIILSARFSK